VLLLMLFLTQLGLSQIKVDEYDTRITFNNENYIYSYKHGLILEEDGKFTVIDSNNYGEPFIYENQLILGSAINGYFKLTDEKKLISFDTGFLIDEIYNFDYLKLKASKGCSHCFNYTTVLESVSYSKTSTNLLAREKNIPTRYYATPKVIFKTNIDNLIKLATRQLNLELNTSKFEFSDQLFHKFKKNINKDYENFIAKDFPVDSYGYQETLEEYKSEIIKMSDSIRDISSVELHQLFLNSIIGTVSTQTNFYQLEFSNGNIDKLSFYSSDNLVPLKYATWILKYKGFEFQFFNPYFLDVINEYFDMELFKEQNLWNSEKIFYMCIIQLFYQKYKSNTMYFYY